MKDEKLVLLVGYEDLYDSKHADIFKKISNYPQDVILAEIVGVNFRLRGALDLQVNNTSRLQTEILTGWIGEEHSFIRDLFLRINRFMETHQKQAIIFNRAGCLFGIDFCYRNLTKSSSQFDYTIVFWQDLIKFFLACNDVVTAFETANPKTKITGIESINAKLALLNELRVVSNPLLAFNRYLRLIAHFEKDGFYREEINKYLAKFALNTKRFISALILIYLNKGQDTKIPFFIKVNPDESNDAEEVLSWFSGYELIPKKHQMDFLMLYKWPLYKFQEGQYFVLDPELLIDKVYRQFINDFYFDHLRETGLSYQTYRGFVGGFFESYIEDTLSGIFSSNKQLTYRSLHKLKITVRKGSTVELCDIYARHKRNVLIGEIKSAGFTDDQKFNGVMQFYKGDVEKFYKDIGITQLVRTIELFSEHMFSIDTFKNTKLKIFPILVVNEKYFEIPLMAHVLNAEFQKRLELTNHGFQVENLALISVDGIELLKNKRIRAGRKLWHLLWFNSRYTKLIRPFSMTLNTFKIRFNADKEKKFLIENVKTVN